MTPNIPSKDDLAPLRRRERRYGDVDVLGLVSKLGQTVTDEFLTGLKPHFAAVQRQDSKAARDLAGYLHDSAISAVVLLQLGGLEGLRQAEERASQAPLATIEDTLAAVERICSK